MYWVQLLDGFVRSFFLLCATGSRGGRLFGRRQVVVAVVGRVVRFGRRRFAADDLQAPGQAAVHHLVKLGPVQSVSQQITPCGCPAESDPSIPSSTSRKGNESNREKYWTHLFQQCQTASDIFSWKHEMMLKSIDFLLLQ